MYACTAKDCGKHFTYLDAMHRHRKACGLRARLNANQNQADPFWRDIGRCPPSRNVFCTSKPMFGCFVPLSVACVPTAGLSSTFPISVSIANPSYEIQHTALHAASLRLVRMRRSVYHRLHSMLCTRVAVSVYRQRSVPLVFARLMSFCLRPFMHPLGLLQHLFCRVRRCSFYTY